MRYLLISFLAFSFFACKAQSLQLHYDMRHAVDPHRNPKNFPTFYFEYYKALDTGRSFVKFGPFLLKTQADFIGDQNNIGKCFMQVSQELRFWKPKVFLDLQYSGGLGITTPREYSYYILNTFSAGVSYHYKIGSTFMSTVLFYKYVPYAKPTHDYLLTTYFYKGLWNYKADIEGSMSVWTENKDHGDEYTGGAKGKRFFLFAEPQFWYNFSSGISAGTKVNIYHHVNTTDDILEVYPTAAIRYKFK